MTNETQAVESTESATTSEPAAGGTSSEAQAAGQQAGQAAAAKGASPEDQAAVAAQVTASYQPNLKYKFLEQEKEFNPLLKELVKTPEVEKLLKELHEKADGLDFIKPKFQTTREELKSVKTEYDTMQKSVQDLGKMIQQGDLDSFFENIQLSPGKVYQWVLQKLQEQEMPAEQRAFSLQAREQKRRADMLEQQLQEKSQLVQQNSSQTMELQLDFGLKSPEVKPFAEAFDAQVGKPGSFREQVIQRGLLAERTGADLPVEQAIKQVMEMYGRFMPAANTAEQAAPGFAAPQAQTQQAVAAKPVIPNIQGKGGSPASKKIKSIAQLREISAQMAE